MSFTLQRSSWVAVLIMLSLMLSSCGGVMYPPNPVIPVMEGDILHIFEGTARYIAYTAAMMKSGSWVLYNESLDTYVFIRVIADGVAFVAHRGSEIITDPRSLCGGNITSCSTWSKFVAWLTNEGGYVSVTSVTPALKAIATALANYRPTLMLIITGDNFSPIDLEAFEGIDT